MYKINNFLKLLKYAILNPKLNKLKLNTRLLTKPIQLITNRIYQT